MEKIFMHIEIERKLIEKGFLGENRSVVELLDILNPYILEYAEKYNKNFMYGSGKQSRIVADRLFKEGLDFEMVANIIPTPSLKELQEIEKNGFDEKAFQEKNRRKA